MTTDDLPANPPESDPPDGMDFGQSFLPDINGNGASPAHAGSGSDVIPESRAFQNIDDDFGLTAKPRTTTKLIDPVLGTDLGGFIIKRLIGEGGMGRVYEARQKNPGRTVAVKVIRVGLISEKTVRRFEREAEFLAKLQHPGIAQIFLVGTYTSDFGEVPFYVMEFIENAKPITNYVHEQNLSHIDRLKLFKQVCDAVSHGHDRGVVHRDLKPGNILIDSNGRPKIIDFGVARSTDSDLQITNMKTDTGQMIGTVQYMSPEQFGDDPNDLDSRVDVYSLGVVLYELLAGVLPYDVRRKGIHEAARIVCEKPPLPLRTQDKTISRSISDIVTKCLSKKRAGRYFSAGHLGQDIERCIAGLPISTARPGVLSRLRSFFDARPSRSIFASVVLVLLTAVATSAFRGIDWERPSATTRPATTPASSSTVEFPAEGIDRLIDHLEVNKPTILRESSAVPHRRVSDGLASDLGRLNDECRAALGKLLSSFRRGEGLPSANDQSAGVPADVIAKRTSALEEALAKADSDLRDLKSELVSTFRKQVSKDSTREEAEAATVAVRTKYREACDAALEAFHARIAATVSMLNTNSNVTAEAKKRCLAEIVSRCNELAKRLEEHAKPLKDDARLLALGSLPEDTGWEEDLTEEDSRFSTFCIAREFDLQDALQALTRDSERTFPWDPSAADMEQFRDKQIDAYRRRVDDSCRQAQETREGAVQRLVALHRNKQVDAATTAEVIAGTDARVERLIRRLTMADIDGSPAPMSAEQPNGVQEHAANGPNELTERPPRKPEADPNPVPPLAHPYPKYEALARRLFASSGFQTPEHKKVATIQNTIDMAKELGLSDEKLVAMLELIVENGRSQGLDDSFAPTSLEAGVRSSLAQKRAHP
jgi:serine/threonine protein kinase